MSNALIDTDKSSYYGYNKGDVVECILEDSEYYGKYYIIDAMSFSGLNNPDLSGFITHYYLVNIPFRSFTRNELKPVNINDFIDIINDKYDEIVNKRILIAPGSVEDHLVALHSILKTNTKDIKERLLNIMNINAPKPILNKYEIKYLENVLEPFKDKYKLTIKKSDNFCKSWITISFNNIDGETECMVSFPQFDSGTMYNNMENYYLYTPEELGLWKDKVNENE